MARSIWKGAISFGLVHIPVALVSATSSENIDFDWIDDRTMDPVGYKRINKVTGKEVTREHIVKGIQYEKGKYILLSEEEIKSAHPKSTQTIDIFSFVNKSDIPLVHIDTPYYLAPDKRGEKVYVLLRDTLVSTEKVGLANVILHTKQHLAAVMVVESALVLILLRWPSEVRNISTLELSSAATKAELNKSEREMAKRLVEDMSGKWNPEEYKDTFQNKIMELVDKKAAEGKIEDIETENHQESRKTADIIDLTELLKRSLGQSNRSAKTSTKKAGSDEQPTPIKAPRSKASATKSTQKETTKKSAKSTSKTTTKKPATKKVSRK